MKLYYSNRTWLNSDETPSASNVWTCFGEFERRSGSVYKSAFVDIGDCHNRVRIHSFGHTSRNSKKQFLDKIRLLAQVINDFADFIETDDHWYEEYSNDQQVKESGQ